MIATSRALLGVGAPDGQHQYDGQEDQRLLDLHAQYIKSYAIPTSQMR
jgi:hypothetical protein